MNRNIIPLGQAFVTDDSRHLRMVKLSKNTKVVPSGMVIDNTRFISSIVVPQMNLALINPDASVPALAAAGDAFVATGVVLVETAVGLVLGLGTEAKVSTNIIEFVVYRCDRRTGRAERSK